MVESRGSSAQHDSGWELNQTALMSRKGKQLMGQLRHFGISLDHKSVTHGAPKPSFVRRSKTKWITNDSLKATSAHKTLVVKRPRGWMPTPEIKRISYQGLLARHQTHAEQNGRRP
jgi:hypothetical protein